MTKSTATLEFGGNSNEFNVRSGSVGPDVIDISALYKDTGAFTYDPGFTSTASCESKITYIDGDQGVLLHRGYPIDQLAEHGDFLETCYLLLYGDLPTKAQKEDFDYRVTRHTMVHEQMSRFFTGFRRDAHPMAVMCGVVGALSAFYHDPRTSRIRTSAWWPSIRMIAKMPTIAAMAYKYHIGQPFVYPRNEMNYAANFLHMCFAVPCEEYKVNPVLARAMERIFILHADHEQNASTSTVRLAGLGRQSVRLHRRRHRLPVGAGAWRRNEAALNMLAEIGSADRIPEFIDRAKDKNDPFRLMGFGHRVYKNYDPRAKIMQKTTHEVLGELGIKDDPLLDVAMELEKIALTDEYFIDKKLYPNIDFYSGITLKALGFPTTMFTVLFAVARTVGWVAQWKEMIGGPASEDRPSAPALHRRAGTRLRADRQALNLAEALSKGRRSRRFFHVRRAISESTASAAISPDGRGVAIRSATMSRPSSWARRCGLSRHNSSVWRASMPGRTNSLKCSG